MDRLASPSLTLGVRLMYRTLCIALLISVALPAMAGSEGALVPDENKSHSAYRVDVDVFGWNKSFTEMGALGLDVRRYPLGKQRGEAFVLVFDIGAIVPKHNVHVMYVTQADHPHDPIPLDDIRDRMWMVDYQFQTMWPRRPKRKHYKGAMTVKALWEFHEAEPGACRPSVGFIMKYRGELRYQPHELMRMQVSCSHLRMTDYRTYWAKKDLAAVMIRFDYSATSNEQSIRLPLSVAWKLGKSLRMSLRVPKTSDAARVQAHRAELLNYGPVKIVPARQVPAITTVDYAEELTFLASRIADELGGKMGRKITDADIAVTVGSQQRRASRRKRIEPATAPPPAPRTEDLWGRVKSGNESAPGTYLDDFSP